MKQRLGIATALIHNPELIILDEPTNGLDPQGIADMRNLILHLSKSLKKTVMVSSHLLSEMELIADSMLIIDRGKKIVEGKMSELFDPAETIVELKTTDTDAAWQKLQASVFQKYLVAKKTSYIQLKLNRHDLPSFIKEIVQMDIGIMSVYSKNSLEDYFLSLTSRHQHVDTFKA
jgi:ABC-type multidrug transport system ATPase subunit